VEWFYHNNDSRIPFTGDVFLGDTVYSVTITLNAVPGNTFAGGLEEEVKIDGKNADVTDNTGDSVKLSLTFSKTLEKDISSIEIIYQPSSMTYTHGETFTATGLVVKIQYTDLSTDEVTVDKFDEFGLYTYPVSIDDTINRTEHDGNTILVKVGEVTPATITASLTVSKANPSVPNAPTAGSTTCFSITVNAVTPPRYGQIIEYGINDNDTEPAIWQETLVFVGRNHNTPYYVFARVKEDNNYITGQASRAQISTVDHDRTGSPATCVAPQICARVECGKETADINPDNHASSNCHPYIITGGNATTNQRNVRKGTGTTPIGIDGQTIADAITAIRANAATFGSEQPVIIQFGTGAPDRLDIGTTPVSFSGTWGPIMLTGRIIGNNQVATEGTIVITDTVSISSTADIANSATNGNARAINHRGTGGLTISGGRVAAENVAGTAGTAGQAIHSANTGVITISGDTTVVSSANPTRVEAGTIFLANVAGTNPRLIITGGTVQNIATAAQRDARTINNNSPGGINISGGTISALGGSAILNNRDGLITISQAVGATTLITSANNDAIGGTINLDSGGLTMTGGTVRNTQASSDTTRAIYFSGGSGVTVNISGGRVAVENTSGTATIGQAITNTGGGSIIISGNAVVRSANTAATGGTITISGASSIASDRLVITGGTVENTSNNANAKVVYNGATHGNGRVRIGGNATLRNIMLFANSATVRNRIVIDSDWTGSIDNLDLRGNNADATVVAEWWENQIVLSTASGAQITATQLGNITLRNFVNNAATPVTESIADFNGGYTLELSANAPDNTAILTPR
jgi:hypothetical protein